MSRNFELLQRIQQEQEEEQRRHLEEQKRLLQADLRADGATGVDTAEAISPAVVLIHPPLETAPVAREQLTNLVQRLFLLPNSPRAVVFTAPESGAGCSWVILNAARILSGRISGTVCLVDANFRRPKLHEYIGTRNHFGLSDAVLGPDSIRRYVRQVTGTNLWLLSCGSVAAAGAGQVPLEAMRARVAELRAQFDYILIDSPAISQCGDALALAQAADGVAMVLQANSTRREAAQKAINDIRAANIRILGAVLNKRTFPIPERIYKHL